jgi:hypothetical protein
VYYKCDLDVGDTTSWATSRVVATASENKAFSLNFFFICGYMKNIKVMLKILQNI